MPENDKEINIEALDIETSIGRKIREIRQRNDLTLEDLAQKTGLSKALLSKIENGKVSSPVSTYSKIAKNLNVEIGSLFKEENEPRFLLVKNSEYHEKESKVGLHGYDFHSLSSKWPNKNLNTFILTYHPTKYKASPRFTEDVEEFIYVLEGILEFHFLEKHYELKPGDCLFVDGSYPHGGRAKGEKTCTALMMTITK